MERHRFGGRRQHPSAVLRSYRGGLEARSAAGGAECPRVYPGRVRARRARGRILRERRDPRPRASALSVSAGEPALWLQLANEDLAMAGLALDQGIFRQTCFHSQQAAEKALKALLLARQGTYPRTHSFGGLARIRHVGRTERVGGSLSAPESVLSNDALCRRAP